MRIETQMKNPKTNLLVRQRRSG